MGFSKHTIAAVLVLTTFAFSGTTEGAEGANVRVATYQTPSGEGFFAASIQPSADDTLLNASRQSAADVVIVVDTSASQAGQYRAHSIAAMRNVIEKLRPEDRVRIYAADVRATDLSESFVSGGQSDDAIAKLKKRLPLGNTNMLSVVDSVRAALVAEPRSRTRSIVYIGDGSSIEALGDQDRFGALVGALRADRIAVHGIAIGPATNVELMAILANQTGGVLGVVGSDNSATAIANHVGSSAIMSPIWLSEAKLPNGMTTIQSGQLPPLRLDRDSILIGAFDKAVAQADSGKMQLTGETTGSSVRLVVEVALEDSHPDFAFLPGMVQNAGSNKGLMLPSAGSTMLREAARMIANRADALVKAGNIALQQGNKLGAKAVAQRALQADPNNTQAQALERISGNRLVMQNPGESLDDIFGGGGGDAAADGGDIFGADAPADAPAADDGGGIFGDAGDMDAPAAPAAGAAPAVATPPPAAPPAAAPPAVSPPPAPAASAFSAPPAASVFGTPAGDDELMEEPGGLLNRVGADRTAAEGRLRAEVRATLREANRMLRKNPIGVAGGLKSLLGEIETTPDINPQLREELKSEVRAAIQIASGRQARYESQQENLNAQVQAQASNSQLLQETFRREATLKTLSQQLNALIDEGRYDQADGTVSLEISEVAGHHITRDSVAAHHFTEETLMLQVYDRDQRYREMRERNFVDAFSLVLKSNIPFVDEPPIVYPDAEVWQNMSRERLSKYGAIELVGDNETERKLQLALSEETSASFVELPLSDAIQQISEKHEIPIVVDSRALEEIGLSAEEPISLTLKNVSLRSFLRLMLRELDLTYMIKDEVMQITTVEQAEQNLINKVYPVGDLVVPILQLGGGGGMGGGGMGGGGGGGGMFAVPDEASLSSKKTAKTETKADAQKEATAKTSKAAVNATAIVLKPKDGQSRDDAWDEFFAGVEIKTAEDLTILDQRIRRTVGMLSARAIRVQEAGESDQVVDLFAQARDAMAGAMRAGHVQPWMYQAYAIALKATDAPKEDVERALLSAVDFAESPEDVLHVAARLEEIGSEATALKLCQNVSAMEPYRREPYAMGLRIAQKIDSHEGLAWACEGVLSQAWPETFQAIVEEARLVARATHARLLEEGRQTEAAAFNASLKKAASHDVIIRVSWTGDADVDLAVEEPSGTVCSIDNRSSAGGGTLLADAFPGSKSDKKGTVSETYLCPQGFSGQYRLLVRRVWGNVTSGQATVEILTDVGRPAQRFVRQEVPLTEKDALVVFEVKDGQRQQEVADAQLAHLKNAQQDMLGQFGLPPGFGNTPSSEEVLQDLFQDVQALTGGVVGNPNNPFARRRAVGFRPEITTLSEGATLSSLAIISADRRYVRITPIPFFSQIGDVTTFNFVTGDAGGGGAAGGGAGGGLGGAGGAGGGLGGGGFGN
ncbi:MAG: VWA domain-containing protein [Rubripirellula sp.]